MAPLATLVAVFAAVKTAQTVLLSLTPAQFDISSNLLLRNHLPEKVYLLTYSTPSPVVNSALRKLSAWYLDSVLDKLVVWDSVYFSDLFAHGIRYEHQYVFCPLWWRLVRLIPVPHACEFYGRLAVATLVANACHFLAAVALFHYTLHVFQNARLFSPVRLATAALVLFVLSPAAMFLTAPYSEAPAALCSFLCLLFREKAFSLRFGSFRFHPRLYLLSGVAAAAAFGLRANCLLLGLVYVYDLVFQRKRVCAMWPVFSGLVLGLAFLSAQVYNYYAICSGTARGEWCTLPLPSLYAYAQSHYWNNGFFKYWTVQNIPNFLFAAPTVYLSALGTRYFAYTCPVDRSVPVLVVNTVFIILLSVMWHVQIVTRIHTFLPVVYWVVGAMVTHRERGGMVWILYFVVWGAAQACLFGAFLPPA